MRKINLIDIISGFILGRFEMKMLIETLFDLVMMEEARVQGARRKRIRGAKEAYRNGYRLRKLKTPFGELTLHVPEFRYFSFKTCLFTPFSRTSRVLESLITEAYEKGVSTRSVQSLMKKLGVTGISSSTVSRIVAKLDEKVEDFLNRPLLDEFRYVFFDASYYPVRSGGKYVNRPLLLAIGVDGYGQWKVVGAKLAFEENEVSWREFMLSLQERGLRGVKLIISDLRRGVREAAADTFGNVSFQVCNAHLLRRVTGLMAKQDIPLIAKETELFFHAGESGYDSLVAKFSTLGYDESVRILVGNKREALSYLQFPFDHRRVLYTSNIIENVNAQLKRRTKKIGAFPSEPSAMRIITHLLMDMENEGTIRKTPLVFPETADEPEPVCFSETSGAMDEDSSEKITTFEGFMPSHRHTFSELS